MKKFVEIMEQLKITDSTPSHLSGDVTTQNITDTDEYCVSVEAGSFAADRMLTRLDCKQDVRIVGENHKITIQNNPFEVMFCNKDKTTGKLFVNDEGCLSAEGSIEKSALTFFQIVFEETILRNL